MLKRAIALDAETAISYIGETVLMELEMYEEPDTYWCCAHVVGVVLGKNGVWDYPYFMVVSVSDKDGFPTEIPFADILALRAMRYRDRHGSGNVLGRMTRPNASRSGAALPARRNGPAVPANGSTGAAHP